MLYRAVSGSRLKKGMAGNPTVLPHHTSPCSLIHDDDDEDDGCDDEDDDDNDDHDDEDDDYGWKSAFMMMLMVVIMKASMIEKWFIPIMHKVSDRVVYTIFGSCS